MMERLPPAISSWSWPMTDWDRLTLEIHENPPPRPGTSAPRIVSRHQARPVIHDACQTDPEVAAIVAAWDRLPESVRAAVAAMVQAAAK